MEIEIIKGMTMENVNKELSKKREELDEWAEGWAEKDVREGKIKPEEKDEKKESLISMFIEIERLNIASEIVWLNGVGGHIVRFVDIKGEHIEKEIEKLKKQYPDLPIDSAVNTILKGEKMRRESILTSEELSRRFTI